MIKNKFFSIAAIFIVLFCIVQPVFAFDSLLSNTKDGSTAYSSGCISDGNCQLNDFIVLAIRVSQIILSLTGSLALLALIYGGVLFLISAGNQERVTKAKNTILYAFIGILVVFVSYTVIAFIYKSLEIAGDPFKFF